jgi:hypothetical protein
MTLDKERSLNLRKFLDKFSEVEAIVVADRDGFQLASAYAEQGSIFEKKEISVMMIDTLFQASSSIEVVQKEKAIDSVTIQLLNHVVKLSRLGSMCIMLAMRGSKNEGLAELISEDLRELYRPLSLKAGRLESS